MDFLTILLYILAGLGLLMVIWALAGAVLAQMSEGAVAVALCRDFSRGQQLVRWHRWLVGAGLSRMPLVLVCQGLTTEEQAFLERAGARLCQPEDLPTIIQSEESTHGARDAGAADRDGGGHHFSEHQ